MNNQQHTTLLTHTSSGMKQQLSASCNGTQWYVHVNSNRLQMFNTHLTCTQPPPARTGKQPALLFTILHKSSNYCNCNILTRHVYTPAPNLPCPSFPLSFPLSFPPASPVSPGGLVQHAHIVSRCLVMLHKAAVHEAQLTGCHQLLHLGLHLRRLVAPPQAEEALQGRVGGNKNKTQRK